MIEKILLSSSTDQFSPSAKASFRHISKAVCHALFVVEAAINMLLSNKIPFVVITCSYHIL